MRLSVKNMKRFLIIADDITGANDTGVMLVRCGIPAVVTLREISDKPPLLSGISGIEHRSLDEAGGKPVSYVLNTESRALNPAKAYSLLSGLSVDFEDFDFIVKKVDSTLRGNIAHEILAIDKSYKPDLILFMPALPDLGRTTQNGVHMLHGVPVSETEIGADPKTPVHEDDLKMVLSSVYDEPITHFSIEDIEAGLPDLGQKRICFCDAVTNRHMQKVVSLALKTGRRILWVGSAGIVDSLAQRIFNPSPAMALVTSISETTGRQVKFAEEKGVPLVIIPWQRLVSGDYENYIRDGIAFLKSGMDVIILPSSSYDRTQFEGSSIHTGQKIQAAMGAIAAAILEEVKLSGVFLTGGDMAMGFFSRIGANRFTVASEVLLGTPLLNITGTKYAGMKVITKAGAFGQPDAILYCLRKLKENMPAFSLDGFQIN